MSERLTKLEIIEETVAFYSEDVSRRASDSNDMCSYRTEDGRKCAVGRACLAKAPAAFWKAEDAVTFTFPWELDSLLKAKYRGHSVKFWRDLQCLHDQGSNWGIGGLTKDGERRLSDIKDAWA